jgi:hypothetical protein
MKKVEGKTEMTFDEWLLYGVTRAWTTPPICETHDGFAKTKAEAENNSCVHYMRLHENVESADRVLEEFPPASWRAQTRGIEWED